MGGQEAGEEGPGPPSTAEDQAGQSPGGERPEGRVLRKSALREPQVCRPFGDRLAQDHVPQVSHRYDSGHAAHRLFRLMETSAG